MTRNITMVVVAVTVGATFVLLFYAISRHGQREADRFATAQTCINGGGQYITTRGRFGRSKCLFPVKP